MTEAEKKRQTVTAEEIEQTRSLLMETKVPRPRNPKAADENQPADFVCLRCGQQWPDLFNPANERTCKACRSNSVRWLRSG